MMGAKARQFRPVPAVALDEVVPADHVYRHLARVLARSVVRDRVQDMVKRDMTLDQVKAAKPTADWDPRYDKNTFWTPDMFVEAAYKSLTQGKK